ncbi:MAG: acyltransferase family protein [Cellulosimicrobium funkei]
MLASMTSARVEAAPVAKHHRRLDVQGLRAVAVLAVIANHAMDWPRGGFLGVDVFFVVSGFIITALLLREHERTGRISFADFYRRRVKRIFPAATLVLAVTVVGSWLVFGGERARQIGFDAVASFFFVGNWRFAAEGVDYWADTGETSPLQHYWSLGVEEQFYLVWPAILAFAAFIAIRRGARVRVVIGAVLALMVAGSLAWGYWQTGAQPTVAYFSSLTRAWELALGALVAIAGPVFERMRDSWRAPLAWFGILGLGASFLLLDEGGMPVPGALPATLATAAIIVAGTGGNPPELWPLTNKATVAVGDWSFSLYLWHLPVIIFLGTVVTVHERKFLVAVLAITLVLTIATYYLIENPLRRARWLTRDSGRLSWVATGVTAVAVVAGVATTALVPAPMAAIGTTAIGVALPLTTQEQVEGELREALQDTEWPELSPTMADVAALGLPEEDQEGCSNVDLTDPSACNFTHEGATHTAIVMGDSTSIVLLPMIRKALGDDWNVKGLMMAGCYQVDITRWYDSDEAKEACEAHKPAALDEAAALDPDLIIVSNLYTGVYHLDPPADALGGGGSYRWAFETEKLASQLKQVTDDVVFVASPPRREGQIGCAVAGSVPADCVHTVDDLYREVTEGAGAAVTAADATYLTTEEWFCVDGSCPAFAGSTPTMRDDIHMTRQYSALLAPLLRDRLEEAGVLGG